MIFRRRLVVDQQNLDLQHASAFSETGWTGAFESCIERWIKQRFGHPSPVQSAAWPLIASGQDVLISAPTGSGKTLAAFLWTIDGLFRKAMAGEPVNCCQTVYISPLRALVRDVQTNLLEPIEVIRNKAGLGKVGLQVAVRTGDTPSIERQRMLRHPPQVLATTPESLYLLLTSAGGRRLLGDVRTVVVDEIHALANTKRGAHLMLSLERLEALLAQRPQRLGLSATQKPIEEMARFLVGTGRTAPQIVDYGHVRERQVRLEIPHTDSLSAIATNQLWEFVYDRISELTKNKRTILVFVNTRRLAERVGRYLAERVGAKQVAVHHGSLAREEREEAERRLKSGSLSVLVATASLELGLDIGMVDLVCQIGSPHAVSTFLQRLGRSGHGVGMISRGRLFPLTRSDLVECVALLDALDRDWLETITVSGSGPTDVLVQQMVAEVAARGEVSSEVLFGQLVRAWPYRDLDKETFGELLNMISRGFSTRLGRHLAHLRFDQQEKKIYARPGARRFAIENGGVIPDLFDYDVKLLPENLSIGTVSEDFAFESMTGDVFQLGNRSYRLIQVRSGTAYVEDAAGAPPSIPFWFGDAPGRTKVLSQAVSELYAKCESALREGGVERCVKFLMTIPGLTQHAALELTEFLNESKNALGTLPGSDRVLVERFFDEVGDQHLVLHYPCGIQLNRAYGMALRKRFCRQFNFELQAAADDDSVILSLGATHSFHLNTLAKFLNAQTVRTMLVQAILQSPMFSTRWRWIAATALALARRRAGKRLPAPFQRADAEDLVAHVFPDQLACQDNLTGPREVPDHPLVSQTLNECLDVLMDCSGLERLLSDLQKGSMHFFARDLPAPSPLAESIIHARPWAFLDETPAEERRTRAIPSTRLGIWSKELSQGQLGGRQDLVDQIRREAWPSLAGVEAACDALSVLGFLTDEEVGRSNGDAVMHQLLEQRRAGRVRTANGQVLWVSLQRAGEILSVAPGATIEPAKLVTDSMSSIDPEINLRELLHSRLVGLGPATAEQLATAMGLTAEQVEPALTALETQGIVMRGAFDPKVNGDCWCHRHLVARLARLSIQTARRRPLPLVSKEIFQYSVLSRQELFELGEGPEVVARVLSQNRGFHAPLGLWERSILPARVHGYSPADLDVLIAGGRFLCGRLTSPKTLGSDSNLRNLPVAFCSRQEMETCLIGDCPQVVDDSEAGLVVEVLRQKGALFWDDLLGMTGLLPVRLESALTCLVRSGLVYPDHPGALRILARPAARRKANSLSGLGRFSLIDRPEFWEWSTERVLAYAERGLDRYGVIFRDLISRDPVAPPWRVLIGQLWRMEARGDVAGGRFVLDVEGEQFARQDALLELQRCAEMTSERRMLNMVKIATGDPANLTVELGLLPRTTRESEIVFEGGKPIALIFRGRVEMLASESDERRAKVEALLQSRLKSSGQIVKQPRMQRNEILARLRAAALLH